MRLAAATPAVAAILLVEGTLCAARARNLDAETRQYVIVNCSADAYRLCPQALGSERDAVACMKSKRWELGRACRTAYDKLVHTPAH